MNIIHATVKVKIPLFRGKHGQNLLMTAQVESHNSRKRQVSLEGWSPMTGAVKKVVPYKVAASCVEQNRPYIWYG